MAEIDKQKRVRYSDQREKNEKGQQNDGKDLQTTKRAEKPDQQRVRGVDQHSKPPQKLVKTDQRTAKGVKPSKLPKRDMSPFPKPDNELDVTDQQDQHIFSRVPQSRDTVKECLHSVMVSKVDAADLVRRLEGEIFDKWHESCEVMKTTKIPMRNIDSFLDHLKEAYEGIDDKIRKKMNTIKTENQDIVEWNFNNDNNSGVRYGMVAFGRSPDQKYVDCIYALYKIDFTIAPEEKHPTYRGLLSNTTTTVKKKSHKNFFRLKALEEFYREGLIEEINYVGSLDDIPRLFER